MNRPKRLKYLIGLMAALIMVLALGMTAFAESDNTEKIPFEISAKVADHDVTLSWEPAEGVDQYRVYDEFGNELTAEPIIAPDNTEETVPAEPLTFVIHDIDCSTLNYQYVVKGFVLETVESEVPAPETPEPETPESDVTEPEIPESDEAEPETSEPEVVNLEVTTEEQPDTEDATPEDTLNSVEMVEKEVCADTVTVEKWIDMKVPVISSCKFTDSDEVKITWSSSTNVSGYNVYRKAGNGAWVYLATVTGNTYIDNSVKLGTDYTYKVRGVSNCCKNLSDYNASGSKASYVKATTITSVSAPSSSGVKAVWNSVSGAKGYHVYVQIDDGSWKKLTTTTSTSYTYKLSNSYWGKKISFKVYSYCDEYTSLASGVKSTVFQPQAPTLKSAKAVSAKKNSISWNTVSGVTGYKVYRKTGSENWECIKTIADSSVTSYTDNSIKIGTTYTYTVSGYWKSGSKVESGYYNSTGLTVKPAVTIKEITVTDKNSVMYQKKLRLYYDADGNQIQNVEDIVGSQSKYYLYINKDKQYVTAYYKDGNVYVPVRAMICSTGKTMSSTPNGTFSTKAKYKLHELNGPVWGWYCTRIVDHILFHSVPYKYDEDDLSDNKRLNVSYYNKLGSRASQGCVRLTTGDAYWIYNNCKLGTSVTIHQKTGYEPLSKPTSYKLEKSHNWDPTSPFANYKCEEKGCHDVD